ncbi:MAG: YjbH domain-containing protein, partial [Sandarakinorhabdus sp.]|nr:YjbH domain-containing protein [Sandarakinorhabdus sp.]
MRLLSSASLLGFATTQARAAPFDPYPVPTLTNDFGGVGLLQTPTARFARDGQFTAGYNHVDPYDRYFITLQAMPWLETTLRYTSVNNRLYSDVPDFSGNQSFKDRGFDVKLKLLDEGGLRPALAIGARDFIGTGLFSSEYIVASKSFGPLDATFGIAWGNLGSRGHIRNPLTYISSSFENRARFT